MNNSRGDKVLDKLTSVWRDSTPEYRELQLARMLEILQDPDPYVERGMNLPKFRALYDWLKSWHETMLDKE